MISSANCDTLAVFFQFIRAERVYKGEHHSKDSISKDVEQVYSIHLDTKNDELIMNFHVWLLTTKISDSIFLFFSSLYQEYSLVAVSGTSAENWDDVCRAKRGEIRRFVDPKDCSRYIECQGDSAILRMCFGDLTFDEYSYSCEPPSTSTCVDVCRSKYAAKNCI